MNGEWRMANGVGHHANGFVLHHHALVQFGFHVCVVDGVFEEVADDADADVQASTPGVIFHPTSAIDATAVAQLQATWRRRILRAFVVRGLLERRVAKDMLAYQHSGALPVGSADRPHL